MEVETFTQGQPAPAAPPAAPEIPNDPARSTMSEVRAAAQRLAARRNEKRAEAAAQVQEPVAAPAQPESPPQEVEAAPVPDEVEQPSGDAVESVDPAVEELPSIEPPRSWTSDDKETFKALPRETQLRLVELDRARELEVRKVQNEIAEQRKRVESESAAMAQARQQYEAALPSLMTMLQSSPEFADIRSMDDVTALAENDWPRYVKWDAHQKKIAAVHQELQAAQQRQEAEQAQIWQQFAASEDQAFAEKFPDSVKLREPAINYLKTAGFTDSEIAENWNSKAWRDHRMQGVILDAVKWREAQAKKAEAIKKPVPPVQRPGVSQAKPHPHAAEIQQLLAKGSLTLREATRLNVLRNAKA